MKVSDSASQVFAVFAIIVIVATLIAFGIGLLEQSLPAMPNVDMVPINNSGWLDGIGTGACARVQMEVRGQMVVWRLQDGRVAVVAVLVSEGVTMVNGRLRPGWARGSNRDNPGRHRHHKRRL